MCKIDIKFSPERCQSSVGSIQQGFCVHIVRRPKPFAFEYAPQCFRNVQMRGVWGQEEKEQPSLFPNGPKLVYEFAPVYFSIVQYEESVFLYPERKPVEEICDLIGRNAFSRTETLIVIVAVYHAENVQPEEFLGRDKDIFSPELPAVWHVSFRAYMAFVSEVKVYEAFVCLPFEFLQLLGLVRIELRRGRALRTFSYASISRANADKKALNVLSEASLPVACCQASLAFLTLCLSFSMAILTASSSEQSIMGLRPRPERVSRPLMPSDSKRFTHELTDMCVISVCSPMAFEVSPDDFKSTARQRIRKAWLLPSRKPFSNSIRWEAVNSITLIFAIAVWIYMCMQNYTKIVI